MATNDELEFIQMITASIYYKFQENYYKDIVLFNQVNYYFDSPDFKLKEHFSALPIRLKDNQYQMTRKTPAKVGLSDYNYSVDIQPEMNLIISNDNLPDDIRQILVVQFGAKDTTLSI
ncbi:CYTH domain-containing protein, partial [Staphylococcus aureus]|uniref:CYTH domain-containing protein n=1 Tax=Staphylococcus aureus TaxID=1280 RepID=UPI0011609C8C